MTKFEAVSAPEKVLGSNLRSDAIVVCAWGEDGAAVRGRDGTIYVSLIHTKSAFALSD
jgi:hypothetical protein